MNEIDKKALARLVKSPAEAVNYIEWMAEQPCKGNGSGMLCRENSPDDYSYCCSSCWAFLIRYGWDAPAKPGPISSQ